MSVSIFGCRQSEEDQWKKRTISVSAGPVHWKHAPTFVESPSSHLKMFKRCVREDRQRRNLMLLKFRARTGGSNSKRAGRLVHRILFVWLLSNKSIAC